MAPYRIFFSNISIFYSVAIMAEIINKFRKKASRKLPATLAFLALGLVSTVWFLVRVIPKPSRARYFLFKRRYALFAATFTAGLIFGITTLLTNLSKASAITNAVLEEVNQPIGTGVG